MARKFQAEPEFKFSLTRIGGTIRELHTRVEQKDVITLMRDKTHIGNCTLRGHLVCLRMRLRDARKLRQRQPVPWMRAVAFANPARIPARYPDPLRDGRRRCLHKCRLDFL